MTPGALIADVTQPLSSAAGALSAAFSAANDVAEISSATKAGEKCRCIRLKIIMMLI